MLGRCVHEGLESLVKTVNGLSGELQAERTEARDREQRLKAQIREMQRVQRAGRSMQR